MVALPRMRTVAQLTKYFKEEDPETTINEYFIRMMIKSGKLPVVKAGNKNLVNLDKLIEYLNNESEVEVHNESEKVQSNYGKIRKVEL